MSDDDAPKTAAGMIVAEALKVVPKGARELAGHNVGVALVGATHAMGEIATLAKWLSSVPRGAAEFAARIFARRRRTPTGKRLLPPTTMLLTAAVGYAETADADLRAGFENLLASAMDADRAHRVHPSFVRMLAEMTGLEARMLRLMKKGGGFRTFEKLSEALGVVVDDHAVAVAMEHLDRLGLVKTEPSGIMAVTGDGGAPGWISIGKSVMTPMTEHNERTLVAVPFYGSYSVTSLGYDFIAVVDPDAE